MKKKKVVLIISILAAILILAGLTYAYYTSGIVGSESTSTITLSSGYMEIVVDGGEQIIAEGIYPNSAEPFAEKHITLTAKNTTVVNVPYTIRLVVDYNDFTEGAIKYSLEGDNESASGDTITNKEMVTVYGSPYLGTGYFGKGSNLVHSYTLKIWFPETGKDQSIDMEKTFLAHIEAYGKIIETPKGWYEADNTHLLGAIRDQSALNTEDLGMTVPGVDIAEEDEQLRVADDDYGTSYYFRGNVQNNYVQFADKCWKIVRIDGNGNIKLILWNKDGKDCTISSAQGQVFNNGKYTKEGSDTKYNIYNTASGVGFMYGEPDSKQTNVYAEGGAQENKYDSSMLSYLKTWYEDTFKVKDNTLTSNYTEMLADVIWCGDKSFYSGPGYAESGDTDKIDTYFNAYKRLTQNPKSPSLVCPSTSIVAGETVNIGNISKYTAADTKNGNGLLKKEVGKDANNNPIYKLYKVGLITADEVAFAGGAYNKANSTYYLYTGLNSHFWTMSPSHFVGTYAYVWYVYSTGSLNVNVGVDNGHGARPAVSLKSTATITKGDGTINNPYKVYVEGEV